MFGADNPGGKATGLATTSRFMISWVDIANIVDRFLVSDILGVASALDEYILRRKVSVAFVLGTV